MSAKKSKQGASQPAAAAPIPAAASAAEPGPGENSAWLDSTDPRKRLGGKIIFVAVWIYVAALWLLALDQTFHWGIFGPKVPPVG